LGIFGSYAKENYTNNSDIDIAYCLNKKVFFSKFKGFKAVSKIAEIQNNLSKLLSKKVDFISIHSSNNILNQNITKSIIYV
jgi:predicted nucleotidyltransferase